MILTSIELRAQEKQVRMYLQAKGIPKGMPENVDILEQYGHRAISEAPKNK